ncbi:MAG: TrkA C-terminal domain-containing protein, partial [Calditrichota bacterium]
YEIGAFHMVSLLLKPGVIDFVDLVKREKNIDLKMEEVIVGTESQLIGTTLETSICKPLDIIVVAIIRPGNQFLYNPPADTVIERRDRVIAIGKSDQLTNLNQLCAREIA